MQKTTLTLGLFLSLCNSNNLQAETISIENDSTYDYIGAFVYVRGDKVSTPKDFFSIQAQDQTDVEMPKQKPLKGSRHLFVTSLYWMTPEIFYNRRLSSLKNIQQQDDTANIIHIGKGGLTGSTKTRIIIDQYSEKKPKLSAR